MQITNSFHSLAVCLLSSFYGHSESTNLECGFNAGKFSYSLTDRSTYYCRARNDDITTRQAAIINEVTGAHDNNKDNDYVLGFIVYGGDVFYFLQGLEKFFTNLKAITFLRCHLKEVHQRDLKPFPKLLDLYLYHNDIEVIEEGLFDFNPQLIYIQLSNNKIVHIHPNVFDHLSKLTELYLGSNLCINNEADNSAGMRDLFQQLQSPSKCKSSEFSNLEEKLKKLESNAKSLNPESFKEQLENLEAEIKNSAFADFFSTKIEELKALEIEEATTSSSFNPCICEAASQTGLENHAIFGDLKDVLLEIKDLRASQNETISKFDDKIQLFEDNLVNFRAENTKKLKKIEDDLKLSEFRLKKKIDEISIKVGAMGEKLEKIINALNIS